VKNITTLGYSEDYAEDILRILLEDGWLLIDIRMSPYASPFYNFWHGEALKKEFPGKYWHLPQLGNKNYKKEDRHKGIEISNLEDGIRKIQILLNHGYKLILLCGCKDYHKCHREKVYEAIEKYCHE
jgi:hypothetical protein